MNYKEQLVSPKWQMRRLQIFQRDNCTCQICGDTETELHVHHKKYTWGKKAWEAEDEDLQTLCKVCHLVVEVMKKRIPNVETISITRLPSVNYKLYLGVFRDNETNRTGVAMFQYYKDDITDNMVLNQNCVKKLIETLSTISYG